ncbi:MBL fold metallo-hydrolase [Luteimonas kalidii]|uniref:MBL fold metallo-hydrolase n=1 Tax=Luteimonas kalidii TaxID=3042025 RepID=A0ABT6JY81_9GAMM|nr:MBL fold metallo-hydrolase [Luteimonas kalidii]MDH5835659.1 MBL fold metallo-hydrolase [Luteimonas kalidii]
MRLHHLNCISTCPLGGRLMDGRSFTLAARGHLACHCVLAVTNTGLVLVDTGLGLRDVANPRSRLSGFFLALLRPELREQMTACRQIQRLGFSPRDVRHIVLTHLDFDHAGGLDDFPHARVHMLAREAEYAQLQTTWLDRQRFRPAQWSSRARWRSYEPGEGERWMGLGGVRALDGLPPEILIVPLPGHTHGHAGVAIRAADGWILLAGDAYFHANEMLARPSCPPGLRLYQTMMEKDRRLRLSNQERLRRLRQAHASEVEIFCSHDIDEFERLSGRAASMPAAGVVAAEAA